MSEVKNILLVGVGGQGTILTSKILTKGFMEYGYDIKMSEIHGMSQRGGSVTTQIRYGEKVYSPVIEKGQADIIVSFEKCEALRWLEFLKRDAILVINDYEIHPFTVSTGADVYPDKIIEEYKAQVKNVFTLDAHDIAVKTGNFKTMNIVLLGALVKLLKLDSIDWEKIIRETVPPKAADINVKAFQNGYAI